MVGRGLRRLGLTPTGTAVFLLAGAGWGVARALSSRVLFLMVYGTVLGLVLAAVASRRRLALVVSRSRLPTRMREGQSIEVHLTLQARRAATTIVLEEEVPDRLGPRVAVPVARVAPGQEVEHTYWLRPSLRGVYRLGPVTASWSDPFGMTRQRQRLAQPETIIVHPATESVHDRVLTRMWEDPPVRPPISKPWPTGFEFYGMRDYVPGDDIRRVVWKAVAKTDRMLVRESEQGITDRCVIALNTDRLTHSAGQPSQTFETAVRVVASLGARHVKDGFSVTVLGNQGALGTQLRGPRARVTLLDALARVQLSNVRFRDVGARLIRESRRGAHFAVITPELDREMTSRLRLVLEAGVSLVVVVVMTEDTEPQTIHRATSLGCPVVEIPTELPLDSAFRHLGGTRAFR